MMHMVLCVKVFKYGGVMFSSYCSPLNVATVALIFSPVRVLHVKLYTEGLNAMADVVKRITKHHGPIKRPTEK